MKSLLFVLTLLLVNPGEIEEITQKLARITGLTLTRKIPARTITRDELKKQLDRRIRREVKPEELRLEEVALKMLGFLPENYNLRESTVDLLSEQAAAFYDYKKRTLFLVESDTGYAERTALAHELAHALADQHFHLGRYIRSGTNSDDAAAARLAVMEGQATWLTAAFLAGADRPQEGMLDRLARSMSGSSDEYPVFGKAPLYVQESLIFPYAAGSKFQDALFRIHGKAAFAEVFHHAPASTQQVLHADKYLARENPRIPELRKLSGYRERARGTLGEFDIGVLLKQYGVAAAAPDLPGHLRGAAFALWEEKKSHSPALLWASEWDSAESARTFFEQYQIVLKGKSRDFLADPESAPEAAHGHTAAGYFQANRAGTRVESIEGLRSPIH